MGIEYEFHMTCGCVLLKKDLHKNRSKKNGIPHGIWCCKEHYGTIKEKYGFCDYPGCGEKFKCSSKGSSQTRCKKHKAKKPPGARKKYQENLVKDNWDIYRPEYADPDRYDCKLREKCLEKYKDFPFETLPCKDCEDYCPFTMNDSITRESITA